MSFWWVSLAHDPTEPGSDGEHLGCVIVEADKSEEAATRAGDVACRDGGLNNMRCHAMCCLLPVNDQAARSMALYGVGVWHPAEEMRALGRWAQPVIVNERR